MSRFLTGLAVMTVVCGALLVALGAYQPAGQERRDEAGATGDYGPHAVAGPANIVLHDQVSLCNLLDALWLEEDQLRQIIAIMKPAMPGIESLAAESSALHNSGEYGAAMAELRDTLMRGVEPGEELKQKVNSYANPSHDTRLEYETLRREVAQEIMPLLSENQLYILGAYKKCLFNQDDPLHPERVGQASASGRMIEHLQRLRKAPVDRRQEFIERGVARLAEKAYQDTPFAIDLEDEKARLRGLAAEAVELSDEEFAMRAEELAAEMTLYLETKDQMLADHYNLPVELHDRHLIKLAHNFVIPGALEIFEAKLATLTAE